jgi:hypothetical protein
MTILTRSDHVGVEPYDSIKWALDVHIKQPDTGEFNYGILHGNEDAPLRIQLWKQDPDWRQPCDLDWKPEVKPSDLVTGFKKALTATGYQVSGEPDDTISETNIGL